MVFKMKIKKLNKIYKKIINSNSSIINKILIDKIEAILYKLIYKLAKIHKIPHITKYKIIGDKTGSNEGITISFIAVLVNKSTNIPLSFPFLSVKTRNML